MSDHTHMHQYLSEYPILSGYSGPLFYKTYTATDLSAAIIKLAKLPLSDRTKNQKQACEVYKTNPIFDLTRLDPGINMSEDLYTVIQEYFKLFDALFFFKSLSLSNRVSIEISSIHHTAVSRLGTVATSSRNITIVLYRLGLPSLHPYLEIKKMLGVLLHEMIHAFFMLFACSCSEENFKQIGEGGHGKAWLDVAACFQMGVRDEKGGLGLCLDLDIPESLLRDLNEADMKMPSKRELDGWGLRVKDDKEATSVWSKLFGIGS